MRRIFRIAGFIVLLCFGAEPSAAQSTPQQANADYSPGEIVDAGSRFFGGVSSGLAHLVEHAVSPWGLPNGYILGQEATGAIVGGLRYGKGTLFTNALHKECWRFGCVLAGSLAWLGLRGRWRSNHDARLQSARNWGRLSAIWGRCRFSVFRRRAWHDRSFRQWHGSSSDPFRNGTAARGQYRLS